MDEDEKTTRRTKQDPSTPLRSAQDDMTAAAAPVVVAEVSDLPWTTSMWSGLPQWRCSLCPWDTLEGEDAMIEHIEGKHGAVPPPPPLVQAYDARGNPL